MRALVVLTLAISGCGYVGALRSTAVDALDQRAKRSLAAAEAVARTLLADDPVELPEPDEPAELIDLAALGEEDAEAIAREMYVAATVVVRDAERSRAWIACMRDDLGAVQESVQVDSEDEHALHTRYAGVSGARAWRLKAWRAGVALVSKAQRFARRTYAVARWSLVAAVTVLAAFGAWTWLGKRRETRARREAMDVIDDAKRSNGDFNVRAATAEKPALNDAWERDRKWRAGRS